MSHIYAYVICSDISKTLFVKITELKMTTNGRKAKPTSYRYTCKKKKKCLHLNYSLN